MMPSSHSTEQAGSAQASQAGEKTPTPTASDGSEEGQKSSSPFALKAGDELIHLQDWDNNIDLEGILGKPISEKTETLKDADTMTGSFTKTLRYKGLNMELFSPKQNGKTFWIQSMEAYEGPYETSGGIAVGSSAAEVKKTYPTIRSEDEANADNTLYRLSDEEGYRNLEFEVKDGAVSRIRLFFLIP